MTLTGARKKHKNKTASSEFIHIVIKNNVAKSISQLSKTVVQAFEAIIFHVSLKPVRTTKLNLKHRLSLRNCRISFVRMAFPSTHVIESTSGLTHTHWPMKRQ